MSWPLTDVKLATAFIVIAWLLPLQINSAAQTVAAVPTETQTVRMSLIVTDSANRSVENVRQKNIQVLKDGQPLNLSFFARDERPLRCVVALDTSGSFKSLLGLGFNITELVIAAKKPADEMMLVTFVSSDKIQTLADFTTDTSKLLEALKLIRSEGGQSAVIDAIYLAVQAAAKRQADNPNVRGVVVLITDGEDRNSYYPREALLQLVRATDVQLFIIGLVRDLDDRKGIVGPGPREKAKKLLLSLAEESGGRVFFAEKDAEVIEATRQILLDLRSQYLIGFERPKEEKGLRKVKVSVVNDPQAGKLIAITRPSYRAGPAKQIDALKSH